MPRGRWLAAQSVRRYKRHGLLLRIRATCRVPEPTQVGPALNDLVARLRYLLSGHVTGRRDLPKQAPSETVRKKRRLEKVEPRQAKP